MVTIDDIWILKISQVILFYFMHFGFHFFSSRCKKTLSITLSTSNRHSIFSFSSYSLQAHKSSIFHLSFLRLQPGNYAAFQVPSFPTLLSGLSLILFHAMPPYYIYSTLLILLLTIVSADSLARSATAQGSPLCGTQRGRNQNDIIINFSQ